jgi:hypothetical protein
MMMKVISALAVSMLLTEVAAADSTVPTVTNHDDKSYQLHMDCKHISSSLAANPDETVELESFKVGMSCKLDVYPYDNPYGKDGDYDPKKRLSSVKLKKTSECVIKRGRAVCE